MEVPATWAPSEVCAWLLERSERPPPVVVSKAYKVVIGIDVRPSSLAPRPDGQIPVRKLLKDVAELILLLAGSRESPRPPIFLSVVAQPALWFGKDGESMEPPRWARARMLLHGVLLNDVNAGRMEAARATKAVARGIVEAQNEIARDHRVRGVHVQATLGPLVESCVQAAKLLPKSARTALIVATDGAAPPPPLGTPLASLSGLLRAHGMSCSIICPFVAPAFGVLSHRAALTEFSHASGGLSDLGGLLREEEEAVNGELVKDWREVVVGGRVLRGLLGLEVPVYVGEGGGGRKGAARVEKWVVGREYAVRALLRELVLCRVREGFRMHGLDEEKVVFRTEVLEGIVEYEVGCVGGWERLRTDRGIEERRVRIRLGRRAVEGGGDTVKTLAGFVEDVGRADAALEYVGKVLPTWGENPVQMLAGLPGWKIMCAFGSLSTVLWHRWFEVERCEMLVSPLSASVVAGSPALEKLASRALKALLTKHVGPQIAPKTYAVSTPPSGGLHLVRFSFFGPGLVVIQTASLGCGPLGRRAMVEWVQSLVLEDSKYVQFSLAPCPIARLLIRWEGGFQPSRFEESPSGPRGGQILPRGGADGPTFRDHIACAGGTLPAQLVPNFLLGRRWVWRFPTRAGAVLAARMFMQGRRRAGLHTVSSAHGEPGRLDTRAHFVRTLPVRPRSSEMTDLPDGFCVLQETIRIHDRTSVVVELAIEQQHGLVPVATPDREDTVWVGAADLFRTTASRLGAADAAVTQRVHAATVLGWALRRGLASTEAVQLSESDASLPSTTVRVQDHASLSGGAFLRWREETAAPASHPPRMSRLRFAWQTLVRLGASASAGLPLVSDAPGNPIRVLEMNRAASALLADVNLDRPDDRTPARAVLASSPAKESASEEDAYWPTLAHDSFAPAVLFTVDRGTSSSDLILKSRVLAPRHLRGESGPLDPSEFGRWLTTRDLLVHAHAENVLRDVYLSFRPGSPDPTSPQHSSDSPLEPLAEPTWSWILNTTNRAELRCDAGVVADCAPHLDWDALHSRILDALAPDFEVISDAPPDDQDNFGPLLVFTGPDPLATTWAANPTSPTLLDPNPSTHQQPSEAAFGSLSGRGTDNPLRWTARWLPTTTNPPNSTSAKELKSRASQRKLPLPLPEPLFLRIGFVNDQPKQEESKEEEEQSLPTLQNTFTTYGNLAKSNTDPTMQLAIRIYFLRSTPWNPTPSLTGM